jgi:transcriptional regulator with GAF, ATPase, and Fis domain
MSLAPTPFPAAEPSDWLGSLERAERRGVEGLGRRAIGLERLLTVSREIATLDLDAALDRILRAILDLSTTRRGAILLGEEDGSLHCERALGWPVTAGGGSGPDYSHHLVERALASGQIAAVEDVDHTSKAHWTSVVSLGLRALVAIPLVSQRGTLGVIYLDTDAADRAARERFDLSLLAAFGAQAAIALDNARLYRQLENQVHDLQRALSTPFRCGDILYRSAAMDRVCRAIRQVAETEVTVLIQGETGTGKELVAQAIHASGRRSGGRFLAQNVGALPDELLESELFGHRRGAFSGAVEHKAGLFEAAAGGTVFLDEIGDASPALQVRLLRLLETRTFRRLGETTDRRTDVRVVAATNRDLAEEVSAGRFRADLYFRLSVFPIQVPPLRERRRTSRSWSPTSSNGRTPSWAGT